MFCSKCGERSVDGGLFCEKCGNRLSNASEQQPASQQSVDKSASLPKQQAPVHQQVVYEQSAQFQYGVAYSQPQYSAIKHEKKRPHPALLIGCTLAAVVLVFFVLFIVGAVSFGGAGVAVEEFLEEAPEALEEVIDESVEEVLEEEPGRRRIEGPGFDSPEEAVIAYLEAFSNADINSMISTFAIESFAENVDLEARLGRFGISMPFNQPLPATNDMNINFNIHQRYAHVSDNIRLKFMWRFMPEVINEGRSLRLEEPEDVEWIIGIMSDWSCLDSLRDLQFIEMVSPEEFLPSAMFDRYISEANQEVLDWHRRDMGADDIEHVIARVMIDGQMYLFTFETVRYGDVWYISWLGGNLAVLMYVSHFSGGVILEDDLFY